VLGEIYTVNALQTAGRSFLRFVSLCGVRMTSSAQLAFQKTSDFKVKSSDF